MTSTLPSPSAGNPWREYAEHLEHCATCAEDGVNACHEGRPLQEAALTSASKQEGGEPLTFAQLNEAARDAQIDFCMGKETSFEVAFARRIEAAHGINPKSAPLNGGCGDGESKHG